MSQTSANAVAPLPTRLPARATTRGDRLARRLLSGDRVRRLVLLALVGCTAPPLSSPRTCVTQSTPVRVPTRLANRADILFMIDNSSSMDAMQAELRARFADFLQPLQQLVAGGQPIDIHIGVVTSDYGAGDTAGGGCEASPGGQRGLLQAVGTAAPAGCTPPTGATPFIEYAVDASGVTRTNLPSGVSLVDEFGCIAAVGAGGCGFEHSLESVYAALKNSRENAGFLRPDGLLVVVFVTNEDDASSAPTARVFEPPADPSLYGAYDKFRKTRFGVFCDGQPIPYGDGDALTLHNCAAAPNLMMDPNLEYDVSRYVTLFTQPAARGGVKVNPYDVMLVGIDGPELPTQTVLALKGTGNGVAPSPSYVPCGPMLSTSCLERMQHSCQNVANPAFFADPAIRLNQVIRAARTSNLVSICGDDTSQPPSYSTALQQLGESLATQISGGCLPAPPSSANDPQCTVEDVTANADGSQTVVEIPRCDLARGRFPCWRLESSPLCRKLYPDVGLALTIDRNRMDPPPSTSPRAVCGTVPVGSAISCGS